MYNKQLSEEWIDWVETPNPNGTRESEIFPLIGSWLAKHKPGELVEIGCGQGSCSRVVPKNINYTGIDQSKTLLDRAKKIYPEKNKSFLEGDAYKLPIKDDFADAILSIWVWSHLEKLDKASKEMFRILKSEGRFLIITANPETYDERKGFYTDPKINGNLLTGDFELGEGKKLRQTTLYLHTVDEIKTAITNTGLIIASITRLGKENRNHKGLYLAIEGYKKR